MTGHDAFDTLSGLAPLLRVRPELESLCRFGAPLAVLTELRLGLAFDRLQTGDGTLAAIAAAVGYRSESALSRAFQRRFGMRPGAARGWDAPYR